MMRRMAFRLLIRHGAKVDRLDAATLDDALEIVEARCRALSAQPRPQPVKLPHRTYEAADHVAARAELRGAGGMHAGVDVRGDGSTEAWTGRVRRRPVARANGESAYDALRRVLSSTSVEP